MSSCDETPDQMYQLIELDTCALDGDESASQKTDTNHKKHYEESHRVYRNCEKLDKIWMLIACVPRLPSNQLRSLCSRAYVAIINISFTIMALASIYSAFHQLVSTIDLRGSEVDGVVAVMRLFYVCCVDIIRVLVVIYIHFYFNYPWHFNPDLFPALITSFSSGYKTKIYVTIITFSAFIEVVTVGSAMCLGGDPFFLYIGIVINYVFWQIPNYFVPVMIQSVIAYKYQQYLSQLAKVSETIAICDAFEDYKKIYFEFKSDYHVTLVLCVALKLISILAPIWMLGYGYKTNDANLFNHPSIAITYEKEEDIFLMETLWICLSSIATIIPVVASGMYLNETFELLERSLWKQLEKKPDSNTILMLLMYLKKHPVQITFAGIQITRKNTVIFAVSFIASRTAAKMVSILY